MGTSFLISTGKWRITVWCHGEKESVEVTDADREAIGRGVAFAY
jgi:hypothetical protein